MNENNPIEKVQDQDKNRNFTSQFDECEWRPTVWRQRMCYGISILCLCLSVWCVLALLPPFSGWMPGVMDFLRKYRLLRFLSNLSVAAGIFFQNGSLEAVVRLIGLTATIAWLITAADRKILGVPIGRLIDWAYPGTISCYTRCFIPLVLLGVYTGNRFPEAACYATAGTLLLYTHFMHICVVMLLSPDVRERVVYSFYMDRLRNPPLCPSTKFRWRLFAWITAELEQHSIKISFLQKFTAPSQQVDPTYLPSAILHRVVECARCLMEDEHHMNSEPTFKIWVEAIKRISGGFQLDSNRLRELVSSEISGLPEDELKGLLLSQEAWSVLLRDPMSHAKRKQTVRRLLVRLYKQEGDCGTPALQAFILGGLVLALCRLFPADKGLKCLTDICGPLKPLDGEESSGFSPADQISYELTGFQQRMLLWTYSYGLLLMNKLGGEEQKNTWRNYRTVFMLLEQEVILPPSLDTGMDDSYMDEDVVAAATNEKFDCFGKMLKKPVQSDKLWVWLEFLFWYVEWGFLQTWHDTYSRLEKSLGDEGEGSLEYLHQANRIRWLVRYINQTLP